MTHAHHVLTDFKKVTYDIQTMQLVPVPTILPGDTGVFNRSGKKTEGGIVYSIYPTFASTSTASFTDFEGRFFPLGSSSHTTLPFTMKNFYIVFPENTSATFLFSKKEMIRFDLPFTNGDAYFPVYLLGFNPVTLNRRFLISYVNSSKELNVVLHEMSEAEIQNKFVSSSIVRVSFIRNKNFVFHNHLFCIKCRWNWYRIHQML